MGGPVKGEGGADGWDGGWARRPTGPMAGRWGRGEGREPRVAALPGMALAVASLSCSCEERSWPAALASYKRRLAGPLFGRQANALEAALGRD